MRCLRDKKFRFREKLANHLRSPGGFPQIFPLRILSTTGDIKYKGLVSYFRILKAYIGRGYYKLYIL